MRPRDGRGGNRAGAVNAQSTPFYPADLADSTARNSDLRTFEWLRICRSLTAAAAGWAAGVLRGPGIVRGRWWVHKSSIAFLIFRIRDASMDML